MPYLRQYGVSLRSKRQFVISASKYVIYETFSNIHDSQRTLTPHAPKTPRLPTWTCHISTHGTFFAHSIDTTGAWYHGTPQYMTKSTEKDPQMAHMEPKHSQTQNNHAVTNGTALQGNAVHYRGISFAKSGCMTNSTALIPYTRLPRISDHWPWCCACIVLHERSKAHCSSAQRHLLRKVHWYDSLDCYDAMHKTPAHLRPLAAVLRLPLRNHVWCRISVNMAFRSDPSPDS